MKHHRQCVILLALALAQSRDSTARNTLALFKRGEVVFPANQAHSAVLDATFHDPNVRAALMAFGVDSLHKAFPQATLADTFFSAGAPLGLRRVDYTNFLSFTVPDSSRVQCLCDTLHCYSAVVFAQPEGSAQECGQFFPNDSLFSQQWALHNTGQLGGTADADIDAPEAWWELLQATQPPVGVIDVALAWGTHPEFGGRVSGDVDNVGTLHTTHVIGIIAASTNNGIGIAGVNGAAQVYVRRLPAAQVTNPSYDAELSSIFDDVVAHGVRLINCSWTLQNVDPSSGTIGTPRQSNTIDARIADLYKTNKLVVAAMGNAAPSTTANYPAASGQGVVAVGAIDRFGQRWIAGPTAGSQSGPHIDLVAPGAAVLSTSIAAHGGYEVLSGTSMATPCVTGTASLMLGRAPWLYNDDIEQVLRLSADDIGSAGFDPETGMGRLNAARALEYLHSPWVIVGSASTGSTAADSGAIAPATLLGFVGLPEGGYNVRRVEVRASMQWGSPLAVTIGAWGRGTQSKGFSTANPNFGAGWCEPVPGTLTAYGALFRSYVYHVWDAQSNNDLGYFPCVPTGVLMTGAALGQYATLGCPELETVVDGVWRPIRTVLRRLPSDSTSVDFVELPHSAAYTEELNLRLVENTDDVTSLRRLVLWRVTTAADEEIIGSRSGLCVGRFTRPASVRSSLGGLISDALDTPGGYELSPSETLYVERGLPANGAITGTTVNEEDSFVTDDGDKDSLGPAAAATPVSASYTSEESEVLARTGIEVWSDVGGRWSLIDVRYPQSARSAWLIPKVLGERVRLVSRGRHRLWRAGWFVSVAPISLDPIETTVRDAVGLRNTQSADGIRLAPGDTVQISSKGLSSLPAPTRGGRSRFLLEIRGSYCRSTEVSSQDVTPSAATSGGPIASAGIQFIANGRAILVLALSTPADVTVEQFDLQGRRMGHALLLKDLPMGKHSINFDDVVGGANGDGRSLRFIRVRAGESQAYVKVPGRRVLP